MEQEEIKIGKKMEFASIEDLNDYLNGKITFEQAQENLKNMPPSEDKYCYVSKIDKETGIVTFDTVI